MAGKPVLAKLGYSAGGAALVINPPQDCDLDFAAFTLAKSPVFILAFAQDQAALAALAPAVLAAYARGGRLWIAYPKKSGPRQSDLTRDHGWPPISQAGLVGVTQVALDATWSALRFRYADEIPKLTRKGAIHGA